MVPGPDSALQRIGREPTVDNAAREADSWPGRNRSVRVARLCSRILVPKRGLLSAGHWHWDRAQHRYERIIGITFRFGQAAGRLAGAVRLLQHQREQQGLSGLAEIRPQRSGEGGDPRGRAQAAQGAVGRNHAQRGRKPATGKAGEKLKRAAAKLGADAVFVLYDKTHVFPVAYADWWGGPYGVYGRYTRDIVAVAIKYK